jgi:triosephosphate isomerase
MNNSKLIIANWKMNGDMSKINNDFMAYVNNSYTNQPNVIFALPSIYLAYINQTITKHNAQFQLAAQDVSVFSTHGAFTGEVSAEMLKDCGTRFAIVGHSERRTLLHETDEILHKKISNPINAQVTPIFCIGENIKQREHANYIEFITAQLNLLKDIAPSLSCRLIVAYEPIWAIGTGMVPTLEQIREIVEYIGNYLTKQLGINNFDILYGGSVNAENADKILSINAVAGLLVGGASLKVADFINICKFASASQE